MLASEILTPFHESNAGNTQKLRSEAHRRAHCKANGRLRTPCS